MSTVNKTVLRGLECCSFLTCNASTRTCQSGHLILAWFGKCENESDIPPMSRLNFLQQRKSLGLSYQNCFVLCVGTVKIERHFDRSEAVGGSVLVVIVTSIGTWCIGGIILRKAPLENLVLPILRRIHASLAAIVHDVVNRIVLLERCSAILAALTRKFGLAALASSDSNESSNEL